MNRFGVPCHSALVAIVITGLASAASGAISASGSVDPVAPSPFESGVVEVGSNESSIDDPRATVVVDLHSTFSVDRIYIGADEFYVGRVFVTGAGDLFGDSTTLTVRDGGSTSEPALQVGRDGDGYLTVSGGANLLLADGTGDMVVGDNDSSFGHAVITDSFTLATINDDLTVGNAGFGRMDITGGALVQTGTGTSRTNHNVTIGAQVGGVGELYVDGVGSRLWVGDDLTVGSQGHGLLSITGQAVVDADTGSSAVVTVGAAGRIALDGGVISITSMNVSGVVAGAGVVSGDGAGEGQTTVNTGGRVEVGPGQLMRFDDQISNQGSVSILGGELEVFGGITNNAAGALPAPGRITLEEGRLRSTTPITNGGVIAATAGASDIHGAVTNASTGAIVVAPDAVLTLHDDFTDAGGAVEVQAGGSALFLTDATFTAASNLSLTLNDPGPALTVAGALTADGDLEVNFGPAFEVEAGTFEIVQAGSLSGTFDTITVPDVGGFDLTPEYTPDGLLLTVATATVGGPDVGDFNNDGVVNVADYTSWRDTAGTPPDLDGYTVWVDNFGTLVPAASTAGSIPEPASWLFAFAATATLVGLRR